MPSLLELPRELRELIIDEVIDAISPPPFSPADYPEHVPTPNESFYGWSGMGCDVMQPVRPSATTRPRSAALLATCRQLHAETVERLAHLRRRHALRYDLDIMVHEETDLLPTWTRLPMLAPYVDTVTVTVRTCGLPVNGRSGFETGAGGPPVIIVGGFQTPFSLGIHHVRSLVFRRCMQPLLDAAPCYSILLRSSSREASR